MKKKKQNNAQSDERIIIARCANENYGLRTNTSATRVQSKNSHGWRHIAINIRCICVDVIKPHKC